FLLRKQQRKHLHSLPTRRSSDLSHSHPELAHSVHEHDRYAAHDHKHEVEDNAEHTGEPVSASESSGEQSPTPSSKHWYFRKVGQDRKSTRLNSSHVNTSYADFC